MANAKVVTPGAGGWGWAWAWAVWDQGWVNWTGHGEGCLDPVRPQTVPLCAAWTGPSSSPSPHPDKAVLGSGPILAPCWGDLGLVELSQVPQALRVPSPPTVPLVQALTSYESLKLGRETRRVGHCCHPQVTERLWNLSRSHGLGDLWERPHIWSQCLLTTPIFSGPQVFPGQ